MPTLWLIRHAESETNVGLSTSDPVTVQLTPRGRKQAQQIARSFDEGPDLVITSPYVRSKQTAIPLLQSFPTTRHEEWPVHEFTYLVQSLRKGRSTQIERSGQVNAYWNRCDPFYRDGEGAESFADFMNRVWQVLERLKNAEENSIVIFTHGQFILAVLSCLMGLILDDMQQFRYFLLANRIPNGAMIKVCLQRGGENWFSSFSTSHLFVTNLNHSRDHASEELSNNVIRRVKCVI